MKKPLHTFEIEKVNPDCYTLEIDYGHGRYTCWLATEELATLGDYVSSVLEIEEW